MLPFLNIISVRHKVVPCLNFGCHMADPKNHHMIDGNHPNIAGTDNAANWIQSIVGRVNNAVVRTNHTELPRNDDRSSEEDSRKSVGMHLGDRMMVEVQTG